MGPVGDFLEFRLPEILSVKKPGLLQTAEGPESRLFASRDASPHFACTTHWADETHRGAWKGNGRRGWMDGVGCGGLDVVGCFSKFFRLDDKLDVCSQEGSLTTAGDGGVGGMFSNLFEKNWVLDLRECL